MATPPSRKPAEHHGMADRKPIRFYPVSNIESCSRKLFIEEAQEVQIKVPYKAIQSLRFWVTLLESICEAYCFNDYSSLLILIFAITH